MQGEAVAVTWTLGKYEILESIGAGGMGTVYRARDLVLERVVAVKLLNRDPGRQPASEGGARFLNEARAVARLNHPNIVAVYDFADADPAGAYFAMEYVEGCTIEHFVAPQADIRLSQILSLMRQLLDGLAYAHDKGVVHRDIKPSNLLVTRDGQLKITDFGIAKVGSLKHTMTGLMIGTPAYMAPERYTGGPIDRRCDVYSAGVVFFELLTGRKPFSGAVTEIMYQICHRVPSPVSSVEPSVPALLDAVIARALEKDPDARYPSAGEFAAAVVAAGETLALTGEPARRPGVSPAATVRVAPEGSEQDTRDPPGWPPEQLAAVEHELRPILGPMARIVVKRAAARTRELGELREHLAQQLRTDAERERFWSAAADTHRDVSIPAAARASVRESGESADPAVTGGIAGATLERTARILMRYLGPIAVVLVRKTATTARDEPDLYARLAARISDARERERCMAELTGSMRSGEGPP